MAARHVSTERVLPDDSDNFDAAGQAGFKD
jgi:hypothetical protein